MNGYHEVEAGEDGREARDEDGNSRLNHPGIAESRAEWGVERPTCVHASGHDAMKIDRAGDDVEIPTQQIDAGERQVLGPDHQGNEEISQDGGDGRNEKEKNHYLAVHGKKLVVRIGLNEITRRGQQFQADQQSKKSSDEEEEGNGREIEERDALMIRGQQPRANTVFLIQVVFAFGANRSEERRV